MNKTIQLQDLGTKDFKATWDYQEELFKAILDTKVKNRREDAGLETDNHFLFVEHPHVYTLGKSGDLSNLLLSENRAKAVKAYLVKKGIDASRIVAKGYGEAKPIAENDSANGRALNRRTEIQIIE